MRPFRGMAVDDQTIRLGLPKGRMQDAVMALLTDAGIRLTFGRRGYRPSLSLTGFDAKLLKPQNVAEMLHVGTRDLGFAGADWVAELGLDLVELLDTCLDPVSIVAAADPRFDPRARSFRVATEYQALTRRWLEREGYEATVVKAYGATEVFPPEDAECIVDNTATGETLRANGLHVLATVMTSSTRLYASHRAMAEPAKRQVIEDFTMLVRSVVDARRRVMVEANVPASQLEAVVAVLPGMGAPTVASLAHGAGYAVKAAVPRGELPVLIPRIKAAGGSDILVFQLAQIVP
ncbi:MAG: ATP phosphoribosyltransferase [Pseudomonadota bacterium]